ncbi:MAG TPA: peptidylprolyl isomerase [Thermoanaerobaculia bacterium]|nr:peptidylprolyl isomerase [Thermoanaerobaculia bacterium]
MNRNAFILVAALAATPLAAQQPAANAQQTDAQKIVAVINGETLTKERLDSLWNNLGAQMRKQYESTGGKQGFLENYLRKRLMVQEAIKSGFDKRRDVQAQIDAAKESVLFDRYIRDVVSAPIVTDDAVREYYNEHKAEFFTPEKVKVRHIIITPQKDTKESAREKLETIAAELHRYIATPTASPEAAQQILLSRFAKAAEQYSQDGSAAQGGDLGWVERGMLDSTFEEAAFNMKKGTMSGIIETKFGYHLIFVEDRKAADTETLDHAKSDIREYLLSQHAAQVMESVNKLTNELRTSSKVQIYPENVN